MERVCIWRMYLCAQSLCQTHIVWADSKHTCELQNQLGRFVMLHTGHLQARLCPHRHASTVASMVIIAHACELAVCAQQTLKWLFG